MMASMINSPLSDSGDSGVMSDYAPSPCSSTISEVAYSPACSTASSDVDDAFEELKTVIHLEDYGNVPVYADEPSDEATVPSSTANLASCESDFETERSIYQDNPFLSTDMLLKLLTNSESANIQPPENSWLTACQDILSVGTNFDLNPSFLGSRPVTPPACGNVQQLQKLPVKHDFEIMNNAEEQTSAALILESLQQQQQQAQYLSQLQQQQQQQQQLRNSVAFKTNVAEPSVIQSQCSTRSTAAFQNFSKPASDQRNFVNLDTKQESQSFMDLLESDPAGLPSDDIFMKNLPTDDILMKNFTTLAQYVDSGAEDNNEALKVALTNVASGDTRTDCTNYYDQPMTTYIPENRQPSFLHEGHHQSTQQTVKRPSQPIRWKPTTRPPVTKPMFPRPSNKPRLYNFLIELLQDTDRYTCIEWVDKSNGIFKFVESAEVARLWGLRKNKPNMKYENFARSLRTYISKGILTKPRNKLVYKFTTKVGF